MTIMWYNIVEKIFNQDGMDGSSIYISYIQDSIEGYCIYSISVEE